MTTSATIRSLVASLNQALSEAYHDKADNSLTGGAPLRAAFDRFGAGLCATGISLEEAMTISVETLQSFFERVGGQASDSATMLGAGIALAAVARAYEHRSDEAKDHEPVLPTQLARLAALHRINRAVTANLQLSEMLDTAVRVVKETAGSDACAVFLYDSATDALSMRAAAGFHLASIGALTIRPGMGITGRAAAEGRVIAATDAHRHESFVSYPVIGEDVYTSQVSVPMLLQGANRLVGVLNILTIARRDFDEDEIAFLRTVAGELAISIENARLYSRTDARLRRKVTELGTLQRVSRTVASTLDLPEVLRLIAEQAMELIQAESTAIFRLPHRPGGKPPAGSPIIEHYFGIDGTLVDETPRDDLVREVVRVGAARATNVEYVDGSARQLFCLPLRSARETLGALCIRLRPYMELTEDELGLLQAFSDSASLAIENAQLYQDAMHGLETASALLQEMHHRVRNNLQTVAALLSLQLRGSEEASWAGQIREAISRIQAIAAIHDLLSDENNLGATTVDVIARHVAEDANCTLVPPGLSVSFDIPPTTVKVGSRQATIIALLINELVANAISHGFADQTRGHVRIAVTQPNGLAEIAVHNDGNRLPAGFDPAQSDGLGMRIVRRLVTSDLRGTFTITPDAEGTLAVIRFPLDRPSPAST